MTAHVVTLNGRVVASCTTAEAAAAAARLTGGVPLRPGEYTLLYGEGFVVVSWDAADALYDAYAHRGRMTTQRMPLQPLVQDEHGAVRFKENPIVRALLDEGGLDLNRLTLMCRDAPQEAWEQFYTLIGYSLGGFHELSKVSDETCAAATEEAKRLGLLP